MDKITGNYLTQGNKDFPLDCETLDALQTNIALVAILGNIAGDKVILRGCDLSQDGTKRSEGYVFVRTAAFPAGEVLRFEGGAVGSGMYVKQEDIPVTAQGYDYPKAYTKRTLAAGVGTENFKWEDFKNVQTSDALNQAIADLKETLNEEAAKFAPAPLGIVQLWAGKTEPDGYALCDGRQLSTKDYPELYKALGTTFNNAYSANGTLQPAAFSVFPTCAAVLSWATTTVIMNTKRRARQAVRKNMPLPSMKCRAMRIRSRIIIIRKPTTARTTTPS